MKDNAMKVAVVLDRSGSMERIEDATVEGMNAFIHEQKQATIEVSLQINQFDHEYETVYSGPAVDAPLFILKEKPGKGRVRFEPRGSTALFDAIGRTINELGEELDKMPENQRPGKIVVVIMTDGHENASKDFNRKKIGKMIQHQRDTYNWQFQYLGANQDAITTAGTINIPQANSVTFRASAVGTRSVMASAARNVRNYGVTGQTITMSYLAQDRTAAMEEDEKAEAPKP